ncbi:uncharacterized protein LOC105195838 [Solenopsis invicta]|uniref:uncharacterized protein LOC105195838 n=1 Tax=Solenopsis invicta TaxID=13686 RepID=UPI00193D61B9|nr:uncharacterized protein LOC105195838 [Solenopsis invicta]
MASSKGKTRDRPAKKRITGRILHSDTRSRVRSAQSKRANIPYKRQPYDSISIPQLVYQLLTIDKYNHGNMIEIIVIEAKCSSSPTRYRRMHKSHERQRHLYETSNRHGIDSESMSMQIPESRPTSIDSLVEATDTANSSAPTSSTNSSVSNVSMEEPNPTTLANSLNSAKALFRKRSLVQLINSYIRAGIEEGKRQAKKYIRKALSLGVRSGYLIPTDRQGNTLRVCPTLDTRSWSWRRADTESRQRRRVARRGEKTRLTTVADRKAMRRGIPRDKSLRNVDNELTSSKGRHGTQPAQSSAKSFNTLENNLRKSSGKSLRERSKLNIFAKKNNKINNTRNNKRGRQRKEDCGNIKKSVKRRTLFSTKRAENVHEPIEESYKNISGRDRDQYNGMIEDNYRAEKRKSISSREDESRIEKQKIEANINDDRIDCRNSDMIESRNIDNDNDKTSGKESVECNMSSTVTREMES